MFCGVNLIVHQRNSYCDFIFCCHRGRAGVYAWTYLRIGSKLRCIRSTPTAIETSSENDLECVSGKSAAKSSGGRNRVCCGTEPPAGWNLAEVFVQKTWVQSGSNSSSQVLLSALNRVVAAVCLQSVTNDCVSFTAVTRVQIPSGTPTSTSGSSPRRFRPGRPMTGPRTASYLKKKQVQRELVSLQNTRTTPRRNRK